jgi:hypothetical protein
MAVNYLQTSSLVNLSQSPIPFTLEDSGSAHISNTGYQYILDLYYWTGSLSNSGSDSNYTLVKYPNSSDVGIFDVSRILNSTLQDLLQENTSNVGYFAVDAYDSWLSGSTIITGSHNKSETFKYIDGYSIFQEPINQDIYLKTPHWPLMTDGPVTQSAFDFNSGSSGVWVGASGTTIPTKIVYTKSDTTTIDYAITGSESTTGQIVTYPIGPASIGLSSSIEWYTIQAYNNSTPLGTPIRYNVTCNEKYPNIRIKWKNRFGQWDWFNFNMVSRQSFTVNRSTYEPQIGSWEGRSLGYQSYDSSTLNYLVDAKQAISVNTNWVSEDYNDIFKQLMVSDEMYWVYDEDNGDLRPITINTNTLQFRTGVVDKTIQYGFDFAYGQQYKLLI